jgi:hypothetical protein
MILDSKRVGGEKKYIDEFTFFNNGEKFANIFLVILHSIME